MTISNLTKELSSTDENILNSFLDEKSVSDLAEEYNVNCLMIEDILRQIFTKLVDELKHQSKQAQIHYDNVLTFQADLSYKEKIITQLELRNEIEKEKVNILREVDDDEIRILDKVRVKNEPNIVGTVFGMILPPKFSFKDKLPIGVLVKLDEENDEAIMFDIGEIELVR